MPHPDIPAVYVVVNGPLGMSPGKIAAQTFQACQRLYKALEDELESEVAIAPHGDAMLAWSEFTTTIVRIAKTPKMWERVKDEVAGVVMVDEGFTEVEPGSETVFASWPLLLADRPAILKNNKVPLL